VAAADARRSEVGCVKSGRLKPWRTAAEIIDWSLPCPSIFDTAAEIMAEVRPARRAAAAAGDHGADRQGREALRARRGQAVHRQPDASWRGQTHRRIDDPLATFVTGAHRGEKAITWSRRSWRSTTISARP
jgi:DNA (cytosine-5)-methyltransferase 1